ncbi:MAG: PilZ domain-containing protein [Deltaproteobacteria bacterium]
MPSKRKIKAREFVYDLRLGMSNEELAEKYRLSSTGLRKMLRKLVDGRFVGEEEVVSRIERIEEPVTRARGLHERERISGSRFPIYDLYDMGAEYYVENISETGLQVLGINVNIGERRTFVVQGYAFDDIASFSFDAECRWVKSESRDGLSRAGFEITDISEDGLRGLRALLSKLSPGYESAG